MNVTTIPNVELVRVGVHDALLGEWTVSRQDLADAVAASKAGIMRDPVIKLGHDGPMGEGAPALGRVANLRTTQGGDVLVGDFVDIPRTLAAVMPKAWPSRSVEALLDLVTDDGRTYGCVLTAVALLGEMRPAIPNLAEVADVAALYGVAATSGRQVIVASMPPLDRALAAQSCAVAVARARRTRTYRLTGA